MQKLLRGLSIVIVLAAYPATAKDAHYLAPSQIDLIRILPGPPAADSPAMKADLQAVLDAQSARTDEKIRGARADEKRSIYRFAEVMGPAFSKKNLPFASKFFKNIADDVKDDLAPVKGYFNRQRPFAVNPDVKLAVDKPNDVSYPSAHAAFAAAADAVLSAMVPENASAISQRAAAYAQNRVIGGAHFPTDIEGGRIAGAAIAARMMQNDAFKHDFERAKAEVRHALGKG